MKKLSFLLVFVLVTTNAFANIVIDVDLSYNSAKQYTGSYPNLVVTQSSLPIGRHLQFEVTGPPVMEQLYLANYGSNIKFDNNLPLNNYLSSNSYIYSASYLSQGDNYSTFTGYLGSNFSTWSDPNNAFAKDLQNQGYQVGSISRSTAINFSLPKFSGFDELSLYNALKGTSTAFGFEEGSAYTAQGRSIQGAEYQFSGQITGVKLTSSSTATPIPGAVWLLGSGLAGLVGFRRKFTA